MGRAPCCSKVGLNRGPWTPREDSMLTRYIQANGEGHWRSLPKKAGLLRCGKSCRLRWMNYLKPDIKRGNITPDEDDLIIRLHSLLGNRWSLIAGRLPGRTDNEIKNYWNTHLTKRLRKQGTDPNTHKKLPDPKPDSPTPKKVRTIASRTCSKYSSYSAEEGRPKIHLPKPVRPTRVPLPRNHSFDCSTGSGSIQNDALLDANELGITDNQYHFFLHNVEMVDLERGSDVECHSSMETKDESLEKLYEEYLQLLQDDDDEKVQLDSCSESLFMD